jgi:hypothetical protein
LKKLVPKGIPKKYIFSNFKFFLIKNKKQSRKAIKPKKNVKAKENEPEEV